MPCKRMILPCCWLKLQSAPQPQPRICLLPQVLLRAWCLPLCKPQLREDCCTGWRVRCVCSGRLKLKLVLLSPTMLMQGSAKKGLSGLSRLQSQQAMLKFLDSPYSGLSVSYYVGGPPTSQQSLCSDGPHIPIYTGPDAAQLVSESRRTV